MKASDIIEQAIQEGVYLFIKDSRLAYKAKAGGMSETLKATLKK